MGNHFLLCVGASPRSQLRDVNRYSGVGILMVRWCQPYHIIPSGVWEEAILAQAGQDD